MPQIVWDESNFIPQKYAMCSCLRWASNSVTKTALRIQLFLEMSMHSAENGVIFEILSAFIKVATTVIEIAIKWKVR